MASAILQFAEASLDIEDKILILEDGSPLRIGRCHARENVSKSNGLLPVTFHLISYHHAEIIYSNESFFLKDKSRNGTYVNGYRINKNEWHPLISGDIIQLAAESYSSNVKIAFPSFYIKLFKPGHKDFKFYSVIQDEYNDAIHLQKKYPNLDCDLDLLHIYIMERFRALQILDNIGDFTFHKKKQFEEFLNILKKKQLLKMVDLICGTSKTFEYEVFLQKMDHISHYIVCISCSKNYVLKKWFIDQEVKLLKVRWHFLHDLDKRKLIFKYYCENKLKEEAKKTLACDTDGFIDENLEYFKLPLERVSALVRSRTVFVKCGHCYVESKDLIFALVTEITQLMKTNLKFSHKNLHRIWHDERITSIIKWIIKEIQFERYIFDGRTGSGVLLSEIDKLATESFPLCMNELHYNLKKHKHLKNGGRFQYGLFLKGIGLSLKDSLTFWRYYFTKKMSLEEFLKNYQYHISHSYGVVGKMADYPPQSCKRILQAIPSYGEYHGCPFKVLSDCDIIPLLKRNQISSEGIKEIRDIMGKGMPQLACKMYFHLKHSNYELSEAPFHPNKYFDASREIMSKKLLCSTKEADTEKEIKEREPSCSSDTPYNWLNIF